MSSLQLPGRLVVIEAIDLAGKTTQTEALASALRQHGRKVAITGYPDRSAPITGRLIERFLAGPEVLPLVGGLDDADPEVAKAAHYRRMIVGQTMFALNRREVAGELEQMVRDNEVVISSRYQLSGRVYALAGGVRPDDIDTLIQSIEGDLRRADSTFVVDVDPAVVIDRPRDGGLDAFERDREFQVRVREHYLAIADVDHSVIIVPGGGSREEVGEALVSAFFSVFPELA